MHGILCTYVPWLIHVIQRSSLSVDTPVRSPQNSGRCLEVVGLHRKAWPRMRVPMKSWLALSMDPPCVRPQAKDDSNFSIDEEAEVVCETDSTTYCRAEQFATRCLKGSPLRILAPN